MANIRPGELGKFFAMIDDESILAHSIRKIEQIIFGQLKKQGKGAHYRINIYCEETVSKSSAIFSENSCCIYLPKIVFKSLSDRDNALHTLRIRLAHELGHIVLNIDKIGDPIAMRKLRNVPTPQEEADAWEFASSLLFNKGLMIKDNPGGKFCYAAEYDIRRRIETILNTSGTNSQTVMDELKQRNFFKK